MSANGNKLHIKWLHNGIAIIPYRCYHRFTVLREQCTGWCTWLCTYTHLPISAVIWPTRFLLRCQVVLFCDREGTRLWTTCPRTWAAVTKRELKFRTYAVSIVSAIPTDAPTHHPVFVLQPRTPKPVLFHWPPDSLRPDLAVHFRRPHAKRPTGLGPTNKKNGTLYMNRTFP